MDRMQHEDGTAADLDAGSLSLDTIFRDHRRYDDLVRRCQGEAPVPTAVVFPIEETALRGAVETAQVGITRPILVGPEALLRSAADAAGLDISGLELVEAADEASSAAAGVRLVHDGSVRMLMKGSLHTAALLHAVLAHDGGLRGSRRLSHVFAFDIPAYPKPLLVTDAVVNISPTLADKVDICQNAIDLAQRLGIERPKVAILSAIETVDPAIPSTIDAAALCKMAERGQITGGLLDGPLAMDDAISPAAATTKHIESRGRGRRRRARGPRRRGGQHPLQGPHLPLGRRRGRRRPRRHGTHRPHEPRRHGPHPDRQRGARGPPHPRHPIVSRPE